ncbi:MAG: hypothetical protein QOE25_1436, partial [Actinomycetota bacterium]|nr:hypothetical protein [Actinomycetota bacterium]
GFKLSDGFSEVPIVVGRGDHPRTAPTIQEVHHLLGNFATLHAEDDSRSLFHGDLSRSMGEETFVEPYPVPPTRLQARQVSSCAASICDRRESRVPTPTL